MREQRRWYLNQRHASLIAGRGKPCKIADHSPAKSNDCGFTFTTIRQQRIENRVQSQPVLVLLAVRQHYRHDFHPRAAQRPTESLEIEGCDRSIGDHGNFALRQVGQEQVGAREQSFSDVNRVGPIAEPYG